MIRLLGILKVAIWLQVSNSFYFILNDNFSTLRCRFLFSIFYIDFQLIAELIQPSWYDGFSKALRMCPLKHIVLKVAVSRAATSHLLTFERLVTISISKNKEQITSLVEI